jgi:hypothetical protein
MGTLFYIVNMLAALYLTRYFSNIEKKKQEEKE